jgi:NADH:ubiquinone oxidoreductase subunit 2 (subunit N)
MYALLVVGGLNTVISAVYYIKVLKVVALEAPPESANGVPVSQLDVSGGSLAYAGILAFLLLAVFVVWGPLADLADQSVYRFRADPSEKVPVNQKNLKAVVSPGKENPS